MTDDRESNRSERWKDRQSTMPRFEVEFRSRTASLMVDNLLGQRVPESLFVDTVRRHDEVLENARTANSRVDDDKMNDNKPLTRIGALPQLPELPPGFDIIQHSNLTYHPFHHALSLGLRHTATREEAVELAWDSFREIDEVWHAWIEAVRVVLDNSGNLPLDRIGLPTPVVTTLRFQGIQSLHDLARLTWHDLLKMPNIGRKSIRKIEEALARHNLELHRP